jgi:hypothetical protein
MQKFPDWADKIYITLVFGHFVSFKVVPIWVFAVFLFVYADCVKKLLRILETIQHGSITKEKGT